MLELIPAIYQVWNNQRQELLQSADRLIQAVQMSKQSDEMKEPSIETMEKAWEQLYQNFDATNGGFGGKPKFPTPHQLLFLLRMYINHNKTEALDCVTLTLQKMRQGGVFDQVGYGFHRYSTDREWLLPHFEKMLYDQALLMMAYTEACHQKTDL